METAGCIAIFIYWLFNYTEVTGSKFVGPTAHDNQKTDDPVTERMVLYNIYLLSIRL